MITQFKIISLPSGLITPKNPSLDVPLSHYLEEVKQKSIEFLSHASEKLQTYFAEELSQPGFFMATTGSDARL